MNESILKALMRLFAIVADVNKESHNQIEQDIVMDYLDRQYSHEIVLKFIEYFNQQVKLYHSELENQSDIQKLTRHISNESLILEICNQINEELEQEQKVIVLIYLLDFINRGRIPSSNELNFITTVSTLLKIRDSEFLDAKSFTFGELDKIIYKDRLLFIDSNESSENPEVKHMPIEKMTDGLLFCLFQAQTLMYSGILAIWYLLLMGTTLKQTVLIYGQQVL